MSETAMQRVPRAELPEEFRPAWDMLDGLTGTPTFVEVFAQAPDVLRFVMNEFYAKLFFGGHVEQRYKQLARLRLSRLHGCRTCNKQNVPGALQAGFTQAQVAALVEDRHGDFSDAEQAVIEFADQVALTNPQGELTASLYRRLSRHFDDAAICELGTVMAVISGMAKLSFVLNVVEREDYCPFSADA